jgi:hypothetical protein
MAELLLLSMLLFTGFCAVILVWSFFDIFVNSGNKKPIVVSSTRTNRNDHDSRV